MTLIPRNSEGTSSQLNYPLTGTSYQTQSIPTGAAIPPVPPGLVEKIESGVFVDMGDLVPHRLGLEEITRSKQKRQAISSISEWLQAFAVYVAVISKKRPDRVPDLMGYQVLMLEASNEYKNDCWLAYDRRFRQQAASDPHCKWSNINTTLWNLAFTSQARANRCRHCFSLFHSSRECELAPDLATITPEPRCTRPLHGTQHRRRLICHQWNVQCTQNCSYPNCRFEHICYFCAYDPEASDVNHKAILCPTHLNHNQQSTMPKQPKPLFP